MKRPSGTSDVDWSGWLEPLKKASTATLLAASLFGGTAGIADGGWDVIPNVAAADSAKYVGTAGGAAVGLIELGAGAAIARKRRIREVIVAASEEQQRGEDDVLRGLINQLDDFGLAGISLQLRTNIALLRLRTPDVVGRFLFEMGSAVSKIAALKRAGEGRGALDDVLLSIERTSASYLDPALSRRVIGVDRH